MKASSTHPSADQLPPLDDLAVRLAKSGLEISHDIFHHDLLKNLSKQITLTEINKVKAAYCTKYNTNIQLQTFSYE
jgi:hypothetical protein